MRLAVIDASPVGGGPVSQALLHASAELPDAEVVRIRTFDLFGRVCATCMACAGTGRCSRHHESLDDVIARLGTADALIVGCAGHLHAQDARCRALLDRLVGAFGNIETARGLHDARTSRGRRKHAALVCGAPPFMGVPAMLGMLPSGADGVWRMLERADAAMVGCATVSSRWAGPASRDRTVETARRLGRSLAAATAPHASHHRAPLDPRRVAAALLGAVRGA